MRKVNTWLWMVTTLLACGATCGYAATDVDPRLKTFAAQKREQTEELAAKLHLEMPKEAREFFRAAEAGDWSAVSNSFDRIRPGPGTNGPLPGLKNILYVPIHETYGAYDEFNRWDASMLQKFADGILKSIPAGSIYFGGTDAGRFVVTAVRDVAKSPNIVILTQNLLGVDSYYTDSVRLMYGGRIWVPGEKDVQQAIHQNAQGVNSLNGVMRIIDALTKMIVDNNKDGHEFYVEESYVIPWMYPYLEPHDLIMKLNKEPLARLAPAIVAQDRHFWNGLASELLADNRFLGNERARNEFAKLRSSIGGLYTYRHMTDEAEPVFKQALELGPTTPEPAFRLAQLYCEAGRFDEAVTVFEQLQSRMTADNPHRPFVGQAIAQTLELKRHADDQKHQEKP